LPLAVQAVALVLDQATVEVPPETIDEGVNVIVAVGAPDPWTVTVADAGVVPPGPVQESV
jgi:formate dehydrogenase assembly factor FdhD